MKFRVVIERDPETCDYSAVCPELPGCASAWESEQEAQANIREALTLHLAALSLPLSGR
jgi:predicted RNase H-like HicB family nuclease